MLLLLAAQLFCRHGGGGGGPAAQHSLRQQQPVADTVAGTKTMVLLLVCWRTIGAVRRTKATMPEVFDRGVCPLTMGGLRFACCAPLRFVPQPVRCSTGGT